MKSSNQAVAAVLALMSLGALAVVSCEPGNLQEVLERHQPASNGPIYSLLESVEVRKTEEPPTTTASQDDETTDPQDEQVDARTIKPTKRVKVITIAAPDYSIRIEAKPDTPLAIGSTTTETDDVVEEGAEIVDAPEPEQEGASEAQAAEELASDCEESSLQGMDDETDEAKAMNVPEQEVEPEADENKLEVATGEKKKKKNNKGDKKRTDEVTEQSLDESKAEVKASQVSEKKNSRKGAREERTKRQVKQSAGGKGRQANQKRDKRETKKSGTSKNSKTKRSADKSKKYNKNSKSNKAGKSGQKEAKSKK